MIDNILSMNPLTEENKRLSVKFNRSFVDLASERVSGKALSCSDDFFAEMDNLLKSGRGIFIEDKYTDRGKWMDGWESRRSYGRQDKNGQLHDHDWCIIQLGITGKINGFEIDTNYFRGNAPQFISVDGCYIANGSDQNINEPNQNTQWQTILVKQQVEPHLQNFFEIDSDKTWTHVRLNMFPDGGIARFRVFGEAVTDWKEIADDDLIDLASIKNGGKALLVSDMFFSDKNNLIMPGRGKNMGDGWETKRRRDPGPDWSIVKLADRGCIAKVIIDTCHFKGNYPDTFMLQGIDIKELNLNKNFLQQGCSESEYFEQNQMNLTWKPIIRRSKLFADKEHIFKTEIESNHSQSFTHVKLSIFPDGGISRMRVFGKRVT